MIELLHKAEFWVLLGFIIFVVLVWKKGRLAIAGALDGRAERIRHRISEAETLRAEAEAMLREAEERQKTALQQTERTLADAKGEAARIKDRATNDIAALLERRRRAAVEKIGQAEAAAVAEVRQYAAHVAIAAARQVLARQVQGALADHMIDQAISELPRRLKSSTAR
jgi:F-type H+-transporting ATPase subunit b